MSPVLAHPGHDHGGPALAVRGDIQPRTTTHTDIFEMVAIKTEERLLVFLDDYVGNTPVAGAELELLIDGELGPLSEIAPGIYAADWTPPADVEALDITAIVTAGSRSDLLLATLELPPAPKETMQAVTVLGSVAINLRTLLVLVAFLLGAAAAYLLLPRRQVTAAVPAEGIPPPDDQGTDPRLLRSGS